MGSAALVIDWFDRLMAVNDEAFEQDIDEPAYHALMAALHCAEDLRDESRLRRVERGAGEQRDWINSRAPAHRLASLQARSRGHQSDFALAAQQAGAQASLTKRSHRPFSGEAVGHLADVERS